MKDSTIRTVLRRLEEKGYSRHEDRRPHIYLQGLRRATERGGARGEEHHRPVLRRLGRTTRARHGRQRRARSQTTGTLGTPNCRTEHGRDHSTKKGKQVMTHIFLQASTSILTELANAAVRALSLAGMAAIALAAFRVRETSQRLFLWTAVLYAALALPFLGRILPPLPVPTPAFQSVSTQPMLTLPDRARSDARITADDMIVGRRNRRDDPKAGQPSSSASSGEALRSHPSFR